MRDREFDHGLKSSTARVDRPKPSSVWGTFTGFRVRCWHAFIGQFRVSQTQASQPNTLLGASEIEGL